MKNSFWVMALFIIGFGTTFTSCESSGEKVENAKEDVADAEENLAEARQDYLEDVADFKQQKANRIAANNREIADFNARLKLEQNEVDFSEKIAELERRNRDLQMQLDSYKAESMSNWENFKNEFNKDMDQLGAALRDLTVNNG